MLKEKTDTASFPSALLSTVPGAAKVFVAGEKAQAGEIVVRK